METSVDPLDCWHNGWDSQFCSAHESLSSSMDSCIRQGNIRNTRPNLQLLLQTMAKNMRRRVCYKLGRLWVLGIQLT
ncbi:hypothetical protein NC653_038272 [Populus alba x Populus x berolinensis]|uniref:Uncharacterized protein n=1 Tax=Populus alba x Populus x berolinensis TaxID=444605 RepID=A0AAD6LGE0_9ROSI|nr:hypothetical protein NC653_038272 [Populus alba x Populus x berolinensis]